MRILGIETSCDETAAAVVEVKNGRFSVLSNVVASQIKIHEKTGGVVPEVAARAHAEKVVPTVKLAMQNAKCKMQNLGSDIDVIAVTAGPGLVTSLLVGIEAARTLSWLWKEPLVAVNHLAGHVYANFLTEKIRNIRFPTLCLIVSGGHTELVLMKKHLNFKIIGETRDDAAGEAFDKVAKMLGLGYPGGPIISKLAQSGNAQAINFPRPMINAQNFDFSFSGLKTSVLYYVRDHKLAAIRVNPVRLPAGIYGQIPEPPTLSDLCASFEQAVVDVLITKTVRAAKKYKVKTVLLGGGVAANKRLREQLVYTMNRELSSVNCILPAVEYTTDNAAMIAAAGYFMAREKQFTPWPRLEVDPNWRLGEKFKPVAR